MSKKCFVVCPISDEQTDIRKRSDQLLKHIITPVCHACGFENPERVDLIANPDSITNKILEYKFWKISWNTIIFHIRFLYNQYWLWTQAKIAMKLV